MGAQTRIIQSAEVQDGLAELKDLVRVVANPKLIDEAHERMRKQEALTAEEITKSQQARAYISKHAELAAALEARATAIGEAKATLDKNIEEFHQHINTESAKLAKREEELDVVAKKQSAKDNEHQETAAALIERSNKIEADFSLRQKEYDEKMAKLLLTEKAQKAEAERLADLSKKLRAKAARLAAEAQLES